jgi:hypothetical protein
MKVTTKRNCLGLISIKDTMRALGRERSARQSNRQALWLRASHPRHHFRGLARSKHRCAMIELATLCTFAGSSAARPAHTQYSAMSYARLAAHPARAGTQVAVRACCELNLIPAEVNKLGGPVAMPVGDQGHRRVAMPPAVLPRGVRGPSTWSETNFRKPWLTRCSCRGMTRDRPPLTVPASGVISSDGIPSRSVTSCLRS